MSTKLPRLMTVPPSTLSWSFTTHGCPPTALLYKTSPCVAAPAPQPPPPTTATICVPQKDTHRSPLTPPRPHSNPNPLPTMSGIKLEKPTKPIATKLPIRSALVPIFGAPPAASRSLLKDMKTIVVVQWQPPFILMDN